MELRLPQVVNCSHYNLTFTIDPQSETFDLNEEIELDILTSGELLQLNAENMTVHAASWNGEAVKFSIDTENHLLNIFRKLIAGESAKLTLQCTAPMGGDMYGIYRSTYFKVEEEHEELASKSSFGEKNEEQTTKQSDEESGDLNDIISAIRSVDVSEHSDVSNENYLISTQFEPVGARRAFPCIDDPARKSQFTLALVHPTGLRALSNSRISETQELDNKWTKTKFEKSPVMLTYLVAFAIGELECLLSQTLPISVWTLPGGSKNASFALEVAEKCLPFYEEIFNYKFPLQKLDLIAIPEFAKSAMENFGLITFKESDLLLNLESASQYKKEVVFETVAHEVAHQWFGNLVTMDFWDDLWLNEGFATWILWYTMDYFQPSWKVWENYIVYTLMTALTIDSRHSSHPIIMPLETINDIEQSGDNITYKKGCAVVVMLFDFLGKDTFFEGVRLYLRRFAWGNSKSSDLWQCLSEVSGEKIDQMMRCWTTRPGFPVVQVEEIGDNKIRLKQSRYFSTGILEHLDEPYVIPITFSTSQGSVKVILEETQMDIQVPEGPYFLNPGHTGYYLTAYLPSRLPELLKCELTCVDRIGALVDLDLLSSVGLYLVVSFLQLAEDFINFEDLNLLNAIVESYFDLMDVFLLDEQVWNGLCNLGKSMIKSHVSSCYVKKENDLEDVFEFKRTILRFASFIRDSSVDLYCDEQYNAFLQNPDSLDPNEATIVLRNVVRRGDRALWNNLWEIFKTEEDEFVKEDILCSLGNSSELVVLREFLDLVLHSGLIKPQDIGMSLRPVTTTGLGVEVLWNWMVENWNILGSKLEFGSVTHLEVIGFCISSLCTSKHLINLTEFFSNKDLSVFGSLFENSKEKIKSKIAKADQSLIEIKEWLISRNCILC